MAATVRPAAVDPTPVAYTERIDNFAMYFNSCDFAQPV